VNAEPVNCEPWSVLKISGLPWNGPRYLEDNFFLSTDPASARKDQKDRERLVIYFVNSAS
jgi:hypothetical protein